MEKKLTQRIVGSLVIVAVIIILLPLFFEKNEAATQANSVKAPPFPEQPAQQQKAENAPSSIYISPDMANKINHVTTTPAATTIQKDPSGQLVTTPIPAPEQAKPTTVTAPQPANQPMATMAPTAPTTPTQATPAPQSTPLVQPAVATSTDTDEEDDDTVTVVKTKTTKAATKAKTLMKTATNKSKHHKTDLANLNKPAWALQLGSFKNKDNARHLADRLRTAGYKAFTHDVKSSKGATQTRVYIGPEFKYASASKLSTKIAQKMQLHSVVVSYKPLEL